MNTLGSTLAPGVNRLEAAIKRGIPMILSIGGLEFCVWGSNKPIPEKGQNRIQLEHNPIIWMITTTIEERLEAAKVLVEKLNRTTGPTAFVIPLKPAFGITKYGLDDPEGMATVYQEMKKNLKPEVKVIEVDSSMDDPPFSEAIISQLEEFMV